MPDAAMYGVTVKMRTTLATIAKGGTMRYEKHSHFWSMYGNLDMRCMGALLKRELIRERLSDSVRQDPDNPIVEAYLTESGRYVLEWPERMARAAQAACLTPTE